MVIVMKAEKNEVEVENYQVVVTLLSQSSQWVLSLGRRIMHLRVAKCSRKYWVQHL